MSEALGTEFYELSTIVDDPWVGLFDGHAQGARDEKRQDQSITPEHFRKSFDHLLIYLVADVPPGD